MSNYPDNMDWKAYDRAFGSVDIDDATADEIEREIAIQAKGFTADFLTSMKDKFGEFDLPDAAELEAILIERLEDQMNDRLRAARTAWGEV